eukprot:gnl/TRDRNA2_/TRDRNA2_161444_c0_seq3.p1 gnl/TRDRNA2_/TRDRNA2_161444_c0~~gnl/TRDRNA2_/TRDRNA2_161444_c0_seq3.p1  ORF type:complete len:546 (-),score=61.46 gnl/TRDRNA2_/TRDRNA2_161444_c0_seq3:161-1798(-)
MGAARGILVALFGILVYTGSTSIVTDEHYKGNDEVGLLQVEVEAKAQNEKIEEAGLMNSKRAEGVDDDEGKDKEKAAEQESKVHFNQHGDEGVDALKLITKDEVDGHQFLPAEMLLKNVENLGEEFIQPLQTDDATLHADVVSFWTYLHYILRELLENRKATLTILNDLKTAISAVGDDAASGFDMPAHTTWNTGEMTTLDGEKATVFACDDGSSEPTQPTTECDALWAWKEEIVNHVCAKVRNEDSQQRLICAQHDVPTASYTATPAQWQTYVDDRSAFCGFYGPANRGGRTVSQDWTHHKNACDNEETTFTTTWNSWDSGCSTHRSNYQSHLCQWRNELLERCTRTLHTAWNAKATAYGIARRAWLCPDRPLVSGECQNADGSINYGTLEAQWNAEYITIKKLMCYMKVWLGNDHTNADEVMRDAHLTDDTHQADTVLACQNAIYDPNDMNTLTFDTPEHVAGGFSEESITVDLRPHLPEPDFTSSCDSASGNCLTSVRNCDTSQANNFDRWSNSYEDYLQTCIDNHAPQPEVTCGFGDLTNR